jgi:proline iminopeptidase
MFPGGPGFAADYMRPDAELVADQLQSFLIDPHGSGRSSPPADPSGYTPEGYARFYEDVREALGLEKVVVVGHSFGAITGLVYSALFPERVTRFVCVAGSALSAETADPESDEAREQWEAALSRHSQSDWYQDARSTLDSWTERVLATDDPAEVEQMMVSVMPLYAAHPEKPEVAEALRSMRKYLTADLAAAKAWEGGIYQTFDLRPLLPGIQCPTLIIAGEEDFICGPPHARVIAEGIPDGRVVLIPDCGHVPSCESPSIYREAIARFLSA